MARTSADFSPPILKVVSVSRVFNYEDQRNQFLRSGIFIYRKALAKPRTAIERKKKTGEKNRESTGLVVSIFRPSARTLLLLFYFRVFPPFAITIDYYDHVSPVYKTYDSWFASRNERLNDERKNGVLILLNTPALSNVTFAAQRVQETRPPFSKSVSRFSSVYTGEMLNLASFRLFLSLSLSRLLITFSRNYVIILSILRVVEGGQIHSTPQFRHEHRRIRISGNLSRTTRRKIAIHFHTRMNFSWKKHRNRRQQRISIAFALRIIFNASTRNEFSNLKDSRSLSLHDELNCPSRRSIVTLRHFIYFNWRPTNGHQITSRMTKRERERERERSCINGVKISITHLGRVRNDGCATLTRARHETRE